LAAFSGLLPINENDKKLFEIAKSFGYDNGFDAIEQASVAGQN
jgi:hypothetical protein